MWGHLFLKRSLLIISTILLGSYADAALPADTIQQELISDVSGGLNTSDPSHKMDSKFSPYMRNAFIDGGMIETPGGYVVLGSTNVLAKVTGIFPFVRENGQTTFLVTDSSVTLDTPDFKTWTFVSSNSNTSGYLYWMQVRNKMWGFNGLDFPMTWDGTSKIILNGTLGTPTVPKFRYGANYQDRIFGFGIPSGASDMYFSSVITTDNVIIAPDDARAWPAINTFSVGRGDGTIGTALWLYQGQLRAGKEQSLFTIYGDDPSNYQPRKEESSLGVVSNDSVRVMDGETHFLGPTGVYRNVKRISDNIIPDIAAINKAQSQIVSNSWETSPDFLRGYFSWGTTITPTGLLQVSRSSFTANYSTHTGGALEGGEANAQYLSLAQGQSTNFVARIPTEAVPSNFNGWPFLISFFGRCVAGGCGDLRFTVKNNRSGETKAINFNPGFGSGFGTTLEFWGNQTAYTGKDDVLFTADDINKSNMQYKLEYTGVGNTYDIFPASNTGFSNWVMLAASTGQYISDISTLAMITAWGNLDSVNNTNGGRINFYYHTSTSLVNIATQTWLQITPGTIIGAPLINKYIQWASTLQAVGLTASPNIDNVIISHIEGQGSDARTFAMDWDNRYWMTVTTTTDYSQRLIYVKSRYTNENPDAWMPIEGIPVDCFAKAGNILYGGSSTAGIVMRLDYGTNFNGAAIPSIYDTPDLPLGNYFYDKNILKYIVDGKKISNGTLTIGSSANERTFVNTSFSIDGSGRFLRNVEGVTQPVKTLRLRLQNLEKDIGLGIYNMNILYEPAKTLSNK